MDSSKSTFDIAAQTVANDIVSLLIKKQRDYGHGNILATGLLGIAVRQSDKAARLYHLVSEKKEPRNESLRDTLMDQAGYAIIGLMLLDGTFELELAPQSHKMDVDSFAETRIDLENILLKEGAFDFTFPEDLPGTPRCPECGGPPDERVQAGMKCGACAYSEKRVPGTWTWGS